MKTDLKSATTKVTVTIGNETTTREIAAWDLTLTDFMERVIRPLVSAMGYGSDSIDEWFDGEAAHQGYLSVL